MVDVYSCIVLRMVDRDQVCHISSSESSKLAQINPQQSLISINEVFLALREHTVPQQHRQLIVWGPRQHHLHAKLDRVPVQPLHNLLAHRVVRVARVCVLVLSGQEQLHAGRVGRELALRGCVCPLCERRVRQFERVVEVHVDTRDDTLFEVFEIPDIELCEVSVDTV